MMPNGDLHIVSVRRGDESHSYHCRILVKPDGRTMTSSRAGRIILNPSGATSSSASSVGGGMMRLDNKMKLTVWTGQEAVLPCSYHRRISWYRTGTTQFGPLVVPVVIGSSGSIGSRNRLIGGTLVISSVVVEDEGRYFCTTFNGSISGSGASGAIVELVVRQKLHVRITAVSVTGGGGQHQHHQQQQLIVDAGSKVLITCSWSGNPRFI